MFLLSLLLVGCSSSSKKEKLDFFIPEDYPEFSTNNLYKVGENIWYEGEIIKIARDSEKFNGKFLVEGDVIIETKDYEGHQHDLYMQKLKGEGAFEDGSVLQKDEYYFDASYGDVQLYFSNEGVTTLDKFKNSYKKGRRDITYIKTNLPNLDKIKTCDVIKGYGKTGGFYVQNEVSEYSIQEIDTKMAEVAKSNNWVIKLAKNKKKGLAG